MFLKTDYKHKNLIKNLQY